MALARRAVDLVSVVLARSCTLRYLMDPRVHYSSASSLLLPCSLLSSSPEPLFLLPPPHFPTNPTGPLLSLRHANPSNPELRSQVVKLTLINLLSLTLLSLFPLVLSPLFARDADHDLATVAAATQEVRGWFNALLSWPLFAVCFWVNAIWGPGIAKRAQGMMHPR